MNYRDYVEIMKAEELTLPEIGKAEIEEAMKCQRIIKALKSETSFDTTSQVKSVEEKKIGHILEAIDWARMAKADPIPFKWADKQLKRMEQRV